MYYNLKPRIALTNPLKQHVFHNFIDNNFRRRNQTSIYKLTWREISF